MRETKNRPGLTDCRICGTAVTPRNGHQLTRRQPPASVDPMDAVRARSAGPEPWMWQHHSCPNSYSWVLEQVGVITGLTEPEALRAIREADIVPVAASYGKTARHPFDFVTADDREHLRRTARRVVAESRGARCADGPCGGCGITIATGWTKSPLRWADGSPAPLCGACTSAWQTAAEPTELEDVRHVLFSAFAGMPRRLGDREVHGFRTFADVATPHERQEGNAERWQYRPDALRQVQHYARTSRPQYAPEDSRAYYEKLRADTITEALQRREEEEARGRVIAPGDTITW